MINQTIETTPKWIPIYLWITFVITLGASLSGYFKPDALLGTWEALRPGDGHQRRPLGLQHRRHG